MSTQPGNMKNRDMYWRRDKIQETLYIGQWCLSPLQSGHLGTSHSSPNCHWRSEIPSLSKVISVWGKARSCRAPNLGVGVLSHLGDLMFHEKTLLETCCMSRHLVVMKLPSQLSVGVAFWMSQVVSTEECSSLKQNLMQIHCSSCSVIF